MARIDISPSGKRLATAVPNGEVVPGSATWVSEPPGVVEIVPLGDGSQAYIVALAPGSCVVTLSQTSTSGAVVTDSDEVVVSAPAATATDIVWGDEEPK